MDNKTAELSVVRKSAQGERVRFKISGSRKSVKVGHKIKTNRSGFSTYAAAFSGLRKGSYGAQWELGRIGESARFSETRSFWVR